MISRHLSYPHLARIPLILLLPCLALGIGVSPDLITWNLQAFAGAPLAVIVAIVLFLAPGLACLRLLWPPSRPLPIVAHLALAASISVALVPLLFLLSSLVSVPWYGVTAWLYLLMSCSLIFLPAPSRITTGTLLDDVSAPLIAITFAALLFNVYLVRDLPTGLFGDSYHHTMMTQLLIENHGLFHSWQPYATLTTFTYHFGFHSNAALLQLLTGAPTPQIVLWTGQILISLATPLAFLLTTQLHGSPAAGMWGALFTGFFSTIPTHYVNWGRYTQLTGHVVLVAVVVCWLHLADMVATSPSFRATLHTAWRMMILTALMTAAMILTHYLVTIFAALFVASALLSHALLRRSWHVVRILTITTVFINLIALILVTPWLLNLLNGYLVRNAQGFTSEWVGQERVAQAAALPFVVPLYAQRWMIAVAGIGLCIAVWQRSWRLGLPALWSILLVLTIVPRVVGLPGTGIIDNLTGLSALYLTIPPLAGHTFATIQHHLSMLLRRIPIPILVHRIVLLLLFFGAVVWGTHQHRGIISGDTQLVTHADMAAMEWIRNNTPDDARFLVNCFPSYGGTLVVGNDAGWWIPLLTGRASTLPPITYGSERGDPEPFPLPSGELPHTLAEQVNARAAALRGKPLTDLTPVIIDLTTDDAQKILYQNGITHIYLGAHTSPGPQRADSIEHISLDNHPAFRLVYDHEGVLIFAFAEESEDS